MDQGNNVFQLSVNISKKTIHETSGAKKKAQYPLSDVSLNSKTHQPNKKDGTSTRNSSLVEIPRISQHTHAQSISARCPKPKNGKKQKNEGITLPKGRPRSVSYGDDRRRPLLTPKIEAKKSRKGPIGTNEMPSKTNMSNDKIQTAVNYNSEPEQKTNVFDSNRKQCEKKNKVLDIVGQDLLNLNLKDDATYYTQSLETPKTFFGEWSCPTSPWGTSNFDWNGKDLHQIKQDTKVTAEDAVRVKVDDFCQKEGGTARSPTKGSLLPELGPSPRSARSPNADSCGKKKKGKRRGTPVYVCTYKFRGNLDLLRKSLEELGWMEDLIMRPRAKIIWSGNNLDNMRHGGALDFKELARNQKLSRFDGCREQCLKGIFSDHMTLMQQLYPKDYEFYPRSWQLPRQRAECITEIKKSKKNKTFIVKPDQGSEGMGIILIQSAKDLPTYITETNSHVVQEYVADPFLIDKLKFDLRLYVLVTSVDPLRCYICKEGLVRFCTSEYECPNSQNLRNAYSHLTNYGLNKLNADGYQHTEAAEVEKGEYSGTKRPLSAVMKQINDLGHDTCKVWDDICQLVRSTCIALQPYLAQQYRRHFPRQEPVCAYSDTLVEDDCYRCFQILGFDVMLGKELQPYLVEVNSNPSMHIDHEEELSPGVFENVESPLDVMIKKKMMTGALRIVLGKVTSLEDEGYDAVVTESSEELTSMMHLNKIRILFEKFCGVRSENGVMASSQFRRFVLNVIDLGSTTGFTRPDIDILFIRMCGNARNSMRLNEFVTAIFNIAERSYPDMELSDALNFLLENAECHLIAKLLSSRNGNVQSGTSAELS